MATRRNLEATNAALDLVPASIGGPVEARLAALVDLVGITAAMPRRRSSRRALPTQ
jgi:hypothetical protein